MAKGVHIVSSLPKQWHIIPIARGSKNPGGLVGKGWQTQASNDPAQIERWKEQFGECNWGLLLGEKSGVIDIEADCPEGNALLDELCRDVGTVSYRSAKSVHRLFRYDERMRDLPATVKHRNIEFRIGQDAGQSVIPPSVHESGVRYEWIRLPDDCEILPIPPQLWEILLDSQKPKTESAGSVSVTSVEYTDENPGTAFSKSQRGLQTIVDELRRAGYQVTPEHDHFKFCRPGKTSLHDRSGNVGKQSNSGGYQLTNFSTSDTIFPEIGKSISIFQAFANLRGLSTAQASCELRKLGFGEPIVDHSWVTDELLDKLFPPLEKQETPPHQTAKSGATTSAVELLDDYANNLDAGLSSKLFSFGEALDGLEVGPELVTIIGAPPGAGKTCLAMQMAFEAIERDRGLRVIVANAETSFHGLLRRELTRITGIDGDKIRFGNLTSSERNQVNRALGQIRERVGRMEVLDEPSTFTQLQQITGDPGLLVVDYLQKFSPPAGDVKQGITSLMNVLRSYAKKGWAVVVLSATSRPKDGAKVQDTSQFVFRDSSEIEFNGDSCYVVRDDGPIDGDEHIRNVTLVHAKNRHGAKRDRGLVFNKPRSCFEIGLNVNFDELNNSNPFAMEGV
jgi:replicative DNA helicase